MFLDDQIVEMVLKKKPLDHDSEILLLNDIIQLCHEKLDENLNADLTDNNILPATKKVCNSWDSAAKTLQSKGFPFIKIGGFRKYLLSKPGLSEILIKVGFTF